MGANRPPRPKRRRGIKTPFACQSHLLISKTPQHPVPYCHLASKPLYPAILQEAAMAFALAAVDTQARPFVAAPITDSEAAAMFRAVLNLVSKWGLTDDQAAALLDLPVRTFRRWKAEGPGRIGRDGKARLSNLIGIHKALRIVFREPQRGYRWIK